MPPHDWRNARDNCADGDDEKGDESRNHAIVSRAGRIEFRFHIGVRARGRNENN